MVYQWLNNVQQLAYPARCVLCDAPGMSNMDLCRPCLQDLPRQNQACQRCALTLPGNSESAESTIPEVTLCPACLKAEPAFGAAWALLRYESPMDWLITQLKFHARLSHARLFAQLMASNLPGTNLTPPPQALIPVPLHTKRWRERGFNQAAEIAKPLARALGLPYLPNAARRVLATAHQADLPAQARRANVRGAFSVASNLRLQHVAIVDDVVTTGATATALAVALKKHGVLRVQLWCAARA